MTVIGKITCRSYLFFMKLLLFSTGVGFLILFSSCKKSLPEATQTGANTFGCFVNGKRWIPNGSHGLFVSIPALWGGLERDRQGQFYFALSARKDPSVMSKEDESYDDIYLEASAPLHLGEYIYNSNCNNCSWYCLYDRLRIKVAGIYGDCYSTDSNHVGKINFTRIDTTLGIVSGTFEFRATSSSNKIISVTNGRFDIQN